MRPHRWNLLILESYQNFVVKDIGDKGLKKRNMNM